MSEDADVAAGEARIRRALRVSLAIIGCLAVVIGVVIYLTGGQDEADVVAERPVTGPQIQRSETLETPALLFTDITQSANIDFSHETEADADGARLARDTTVADGDVAIASSQVSPGEVSDGDVAVAGGVGV